MNLLACLIGLLLSIILLVVGMTLAKPRSEKQRVASADKPKKQANKGSKVWILYLAVALLLASKTIWGALFFIAVVWIMRLNPGHPSNGFSIPTIKTMREKNAISGLYSWLALSSLLTVPFFLILLFELPSTPSIDQRVLTALTPAAVHLPLLLGLLSRNILVFRHTQQAILLIAIRAGIASLALIIGSVGLDEMLIFSLLGNGTVWLFGIIWGFHQVKYGTCWLMERKGEQILTDGKAQADSLPVDQELEVIANSLAVQDPLNARVKALDAFRIGTTKTKRQATEVLSKLDEVETF
jgi:hypothetical protein